MPQRKQSVESESLRETCAERFHWLGAACLLMLAPAMAGATTPYTFDLPDAVPAPRLPAASTMTVEHVELGRHLFYDRRLSGNGTQSCASCHFQSLAFTDNLDRPIGSTGERHTRSAMSLINVAYRDALTWADPSLLELEEQVLVPLLGTAPVELGVGGHEERIYAELAADAVYVPLFSAAFPGIESPVTTPNVAAALAAFVRSIVSFRSPYDRYRFGGDEDSMSPAALRGMGLFFSGTVRCGGCHMANNVTTDLGLNFDGGSKAVTSRAEDPDVFMFHNTGVYDVSDAATLAEHPGLYAHTAEPGDAGKFRVPTLRNIALTAPYMHDGSIASLDDVLDHYVAGGRARGTLQSESIQPLQLTAAERRDLISFLESLTDFEALTDPRWTNPWPCDTCVQ